MRITFEMLGETQFEREILRVGNRGGDARPAFRTIRHLWEEWNAQQFESEGSRASGGWAQLADSTVLSRGSAHPILHLTGALEDALTGGLEEHTLITDDFMHMLLPDGDGEPGQYGSYHQSGTSRMPQRRPVEFTTHDREEMLKVLQRWVITGEVHA